MYDANDDQKILSVFVGVVGVRNLSIQYEGREREREREVGPKWIATTKNCLQTKQTTTDRSNPFSAFFGFIFLNKIVCGRHISILEIEIDLKFSNLVTHYDNEQSYLTTTPAAEVVKSERFINV